MKHSTFTCVDRSAWQRSRVSILNLTSFCLTFLAILFFSQQINAQAAFVRSTNGAPWGDNNYENGMNNVFGNAPDDWHDRRFENVNVTTLLANHTFIYLEGSDDNAEALESFLDDNLPAIESWVNAGNKLYINSAPNEGDGMSYGFGGVELTYGPNLINEVQAFDPAHEIFTGFPLQWEGNYFGHSIICPPSMSGMIHKLNDNSQVVLAEMDWGSGHVVFGGLTSPNYWDPSSQAQDFFEAILEYAANAETNGCEASIEITCPADAVLECGSPTTPEDLGYPMINANDCAGDVEVSFLDDIVSNNDCPQVIARTWIATDGEITEMCTQMITISDTEVPVFTSFPEDQILECGEVGLTSEEIFDYLNQNVPFPTFEDCSEVLVETVFDVQEGPFTCPVVGICTKEVIITDACGNQASQTFTLTIEDTQGPIFDYEEEILVSCLEEVPAPEMLEAYDACSQLSYPAELFTTNNGELTDTCNLSIADADEGDVWALWLPVLAQDGSTTTANFMFDADGGSFDQFADGTAHLYGNLYNDENPSQGFVLDLWLQGKADWATWSGLERSYKDDLGCAQPDLYEAWTYYELVDGFSTATGTGDLAGDVLYLDHMPSNYYFGFQIGEGANNKNCNYGLSGWFTYSGFVDGMAVEGHGDVNVDAECGPVNEQECVHNSEFTYFYRAQDECGNTTIVSQSIIVNDEIGPEFVNFPENLTVNCDEYPVESPEVIAVDNCVGDVTILGPTDLMSPGECPNEFIVERSWAAIDICGNRTDSTWIITVIDVTAPEFAGLPEMNVTVECDMVPEAPEVTVSDNCSAVDAIEFTYNEDISEGECLGQYTIQRTWSASDECGNDAEFVQTINVIDSTDPVFDDYTYYTQVACEDIDGYTLTASDNCGNATVEIISEQLNSGGCMGVLYRTYEATDECGNTSSVEQFITITDETAPELVNIPENETIECSDVNVLENGNFFFAGDVYGEDNCGMDVTIEYSEEVQDDGDACEESYLIVRTWVATDFCNNSTMDSQVVTVVDTTDPIFVEFPSDLTVECSDDLPAVEMPVAEDNCDQLVEVEMATETAPGECAGEYFLYRIFRGFDNCGNEVMQTQTLTIVDTQAPEFTFVPATATYECNTPILEEMAEASDLCSTASVTFADGEIIEGECASEYSFVRTFTATDECGNSSTEDQLILVVDTTNPVFEAYEVEIEMPCDNIIPTDLVANDNCSNVEIEYNDTPVSGGCIGRVIRDWTATDACGNTATAQQVITLTDSVDPEFTMFPENQTVECDNIPSAAEGLEAEDNCSDEVSISYLGEEITPGDCDNNYTITRTWRAMDSCENFTDRSQVITVQDTTDPILSVPAGYSISCELPLVLEDASATDNCSVPAVSVSEETIAGDCAQEYTLIRTFTATDACGNSVSDTQEIVVFDNTAPVFTSVPADAQYECSDDILLIMAEASDACGTASVSHSDNIIQGECFGQYTIERTFTAVDACGNESTESTLISVDDNTPPVFDAYEVEIDMPCDNIENTTVSASDNCSLEVEITVVDTPVSGGCAGRIIRDFTATDDCGNSATAQQIITLTDNEAPVWTLFPADVDAECDDVPGIDGIEVDYTDNCTDVTLEYNGMETIAGDCENSYTIEHTWTITDNCDNATPRTWTINVSDNTPPVFTEVAMDETVECSAELPAPFAAAEDNCDTAVEISVEGVNTPGECTQEYTMVRTYTATDNCGNTATATQTLTIVDTTAPVLDYAGGEMTLECDATVELPVVGATDNCDEEVVADMTMFTSPGECENSWTETYTWTATDDCGNTSEEATLVVFYQDTTDPVFDAYEVEIDMPCDNITNTTVSASDNCSLEVEITVVDTPVSGGCAGRIIRDFTATDDCGNSATAQQIITLTDNTAPVWTAFPADVTVECDNVPSMEVELDYTDNCTDVELTYVGEEIIATDCPNNYTIERTWNIIDNCGNETPRTWTINVEDTTDPILTVPAGYSISCELPLVLEDASATDNCSVPTITVSDETLAGNCAQEYTLIRTFTATDACGNSVSDVQVITVSDNTPPVFTSVPNSDEFSCEAALPTSEATAEDACGTATVTSVDTIEPGQCPNQYTVVRIWTAIDDCGNSSQAETFYYIYDDSNPTFDQTVSDVEVECAGDVPAIPTLTASDNCGTAEVTMDIQTEFEDECGNTYKEVIYTATDLCGNTSTTSYSIYVQDNSVPVLSGTPQAELVLDCDATIPEPAQVTVTDNCDNNIEVTYTEVLFGELPAEGSSADCLALTPQAYNEDGTVCTGDDPWAMKLFDFLGQEFVLYSAIEANWVEYPNGSATLEAVLVRNGMADRGYNVNVEFENGMDFEAWDSQEFPTGYKDDCGISNDNHFDWTYYIMSAGATLTGWGENEGSTLALSHAPSSYYYGYQVGVAANNVNSEYGSGGWFTFNGIVDGQEVEGSGDFAFDHDCCPRYGVERRWSAVDCSGNGTVFTQVISFGEAVVLPPVVGIETEEAREEIAKTDAAAAEVQVTPNPVNEKGAVLFTIPADSKVKVEIFSLNGAKVAELYNADASAGQTYRVEFSAGNLPMGVYLYRLTTDTEVITDRLVIKK